MLHPKEKSFLHALGATEDAQSFEEKMKAMFRKIIEEEKAREPKEIQVVHNTGKIKGGKSKVFAQERQQNPAQPQNSASRKSATCIFWNFSRSNARWWQQNSEFWRSEPSGSKLHLEFSVALQQRQWVRVPWRWQRIQS